jgi:small basic protein (TIGR04137 family)
MSGFYRRKPFEGAHFFPRNSFKIPVGNILNTCYKHPSLSIAKAGILNVRKNMSQHRSLRAVATMGGKRNVLKRFERVGLLKKRNQWKDGDRITGLRKTKPEA